MGLSGPLFFSLGSGGGCRLKNVMIYGLLWYDIWIVGLCCPSTSCQGVGEASHPGPGI